MKRVGFFVVVALFLVGTGFTAPLFKTNLKITVRNDLGNVVPYAMVRLYETQEDYNQEKNQIGETGFTDEKGTVKFKDLEPEQYYVQVEKGEKNNYNGGEVVDTLKEGKTNKVTIVIN